MVFVFMSLVYFDTSSIALFAQDCFGSSGSFPLQYEFFVFSISLKNVMTIFQVCVCASLQIA
jgi:hypothetical protein